TEISKNIIVGLVILSDYETRERLAVLEGSYLTKIRTGAISGVVTKYLARQNAEPLCVIGTGDQAQGLIEAVCAVRDIKYIQLYNRTYRKAVTFAEAVQHKYPSINIEIMEAVNDAITNAAIIVTATNAVRPVFSHPLKVGVH